MHIIYIKTIFCARPEPANFLVRGFVRKIKYANLCIYAQTTILRSKYQTNAAIAIKEK